MEPYLYLAPPLLYLLHFMSVFPIYISTCIPPHPLSRAVVNTRAVGAGDGAGADAGAPDAVADSEHSGGCTVILRS